MRALRIAALYCLTGLLASAQSFSSLSGVVTDPSGAAITGVNLELTNNATGLKRLTATITGGTYSFAQVTPGTYTLSAKATGFTTKQIDKLQLQVNTPATLAVTLEVGQVSETILVEASSEQLNTTDASLGNAIGTQAIIELPFESRNPAGLLALQAGVTYFGSISNATNPQRLTSADRLNGSVNGSKPDQNNITLDGMDVNNQDSRAPFQSVLRVTLDSVQEFRTTTGNPSADQGRGSGAQIALVTKSGTNELHGSLYEFHRNTITSANSFFNNRSGVERQALIRNLFGASAGGPIQKNRLFIFGNYEGRRDASQGSAVRTVPTASLRQGIVTYLKQGGGTNTLSPTQLRAIDPAGIGVNTAVLDLLNKYPLPNDDTQGDGFNTSGYRFKSSAPLKFNTYIARLDYTLDRASKHQLFWRGNIQNDKSVNIAPQFPGQAAASEGLETSKGYTTGLTSVLTNNLISTFRYGLTRYGRENTGAVIAPYVSFRSISTIFPTNTGLTRIIPVHQFSEDLAWTHGKHEIKFGGVARIIRNQSTNYETAFPFGQTTYSYLSGTGGSLRPADLLAGFSTSFRTAAVNLLGPVSSAEVTYNYSRDGAVQAFGQPVRRNYGAEEYQLYISDSWRMTKSFTVTAGLNYWLAPAIRETNGNQVSPTLDLNDWFVNRGNLANAGLPQRQAGKIGFILSDSPGGKPLYETQKKNFSPRVSLAYSPKGSKTSIRAGFGMLYDLFGMSLMRNFDKSAPGLSTNFQTPASANLARQPRFTGYNSFPSGVLPVAPAGKFPFFAPDDVDSGFSITNSIDQRIKQPYTMNFNFSVGHEFAHGYYVQGAYVGRLSRRSLLVADLAQPTNLKDPKSGITWYQAANELARAARSNTPTSQIKENAFWGNMFPQLAGNGLTATQAAYAGNDDLGYSGLSSYPTDITSALLELDQLCDPCSPVVGNNSMFNAQYASLFAYRSTGSSNYHAMQWTVRKRYSQGLTFDFNYSFAKSIDLTSTGENDFEGGSYAILLNPYNSKLNRAVSDFDIRHSVSGFAVYQIPFKSTSKLLNTALAGWQLGSVFTATSSLPRSVSNTGSWPTNWNWSGFATAISPLAAYATDKNSPGIDNVGAANIFANPQTARNGFDYSYAGDVGSRNIIRGQGQLNVDMSLNKRFTMPFKESHTLQFRWEVFNVANTVRFDVNDASVDVGSSGTFGKYNGTLTQPRVMQFGLRYQF